MKTQGILATPALMVMLAGFTHGGDSKKDQKALEGTWVAVKGDKQAEVKFSGSKFIVTLGDEVYKGTFKLDTSKKPKHIDMSVKEGPKYVDHVALGIYKLEGDKLSWHTSEPGREQRPEDFTTEIERSMLLILERKKKE
jgi:uncharacterized protein (TIGR03067 family)